MPSHVVRWSAYSMVILLLVLPAPAFGDWRGDLARAVVPSLARRVTRSLIESQLYDVEVDPAMSSSRPTSARRSNVTSDRHAPVSAPRIVSPQNDSSLVRAGIGDYWIPRSAFDYLPSDNNNLAPHVYNDRVRIPAKPSRGLPDEESPVAAKRTNGAPDEDSPVPPRPLPNSICGASFKNGAAGKYSFDEMVQSKVFVLYPMRGGTYARSEAIKYIILHSTETGSPADARRVIQSWSNRGSRHPGAQFVVDRDGTIVTTVDPDKATVHINTKKTLPGYSNDNSIGIEIVRSGKQKYTPAQLASVTQLVSYLQARYNIPDSQVTTHGRVQPSDRSDPVGFDLQAFSVRKASLRSDPALALSPVKMAPAGPVRFLNVMPAPAPDFRFRHR